MDKPKKITVIILLILFVLTMWPVLTIFNRIEPRILGWPLSVFWPLLIFAILTVVMVWLYYTVEKGE